ncbi:MAG: hypothetical protein CL685_04130 [Candidatus Magasanikbacteria bacterium]|nr:hypothetical protein [Candidatus Magasanikbacteria bacterium]
MSALNSHSASIGIIGLGYVGLPLAIELSEKYSVVGFDIDKEKVNELNNGMDRTQEINTTRLSSKLLTFNHDPNILSDCQIIIVTVPTPINHNKQPDLSAIKAATNMIGKIMQKNSIIVYESTVYPGVTNDICVPILEETSGLKFNSEFHVGYSPERLSPGDADRTLTKITKVVSGSSKEVSSLLANLYGSIIPAGIHQASSIKVAEAAKVIENTQRDLNVALMNELAIIFDKMEINTLDVIEAAATKWNFMKMTPGLVGGHCIGVDPYYLTYKAEQLGYHPEVILSGRRINDNMGKYVAEQTVKQLIKVNKPVNNAKVLILGLTFKENVSDIRNSKVPDIINELKEYGINIFVHDPHADPKETKEEYNITLTNWDETPNSDAIILAVDHAQFSNDINVYLNKISGTEKEKVLIDIKGKFNPIRTLLNCTYWSL